MDDKLVSPFLPKSGGKVILKKSTLKRWEIQKPQAETQWSFGERFKLPSTHKSFISVIFPFEKTVSCSADVSLFPKKYL